MMLLLIPNLLDNLLTLILIGKKYFSLLIRYKFDTEIFPSDILIQVSRIETGINYHSINIWQVLNDPGSYPFLSIHENFKNYTC